MIDLFDDVNDSLWCWENLFNEIISDHIKTRKVKVRTNNQPWMTGDIRKMLNKRYKLFQKAKTSGNNSSTWKAYKQMRNTCTQLIRKSKAEYWKKEFQSCTNTKTFWQTVKKFKGYSKMSSISSLQINDSIIVDKKEMANHMNSFFANVGKNLAHNLPTSASDNSHIHRVTPTIGEIKLDKELFSKAFRTAVKPGKACGPDNITSKDLKLCETVSIDSLYKVLRKSVISGSFPDKWKTAKVTCIYKKGSKQECSNYRPISLLSIPSKAVERYICSILNDHLETHNLITPHQ